MNKQELQDIANNLCKTYNISPILVKIKYVRRGRARLKQNKIIMPYWVTKQNETYGKYYIIHEVCHFLTETKHTELFKATEIDILKKYNIIPIYKKVYVKKLTDLTGRTLWRKTW